MKAGGSPSRVMGVNNWTRTGSGSAHIRGTATLDLGRRKLSIKPRTPYRPPEASRRRLVHLGSRNYSSPPRSSRPGKRAILPSPRPFPSSPGAPSLSLCVLSSSSGCGGVFCGWGPVWSVTQAQREWRAPTAHPRLSHFLFVSLAPSLRAPRLPLIVRAVLVARAKQEAGPGLSEN